MPNLTDISQQRNRTHKLAANHKLIIAGEDWSHRLLNCRVSYTTDAGGSGMEFGVTGSLEDYSNAPVVFHIGYGNSLVPYFVGKLQNPQDEDKLDTSQAQAFGPFKLMSHQVLGEPQTFAGQTLEWVIMHCANIAGYMPGQIMVLRGETYRVQPGEQFPFDNKLADVVNSLMEKAEFVGVDQPGGRRLFMPRPRPGSNTNYKAMYSPENYIEFTADPKEDIGYSKVVVYRNGDRNQQVVRAEREVGSTGRFQPGRMQWYVVSDFPGNETEADAEAFRLAVNLRNREQGYTLRAFFNPDLRLYDGFKAVRYKKRERRLYSCAIDEGIDLSYAPNEPAIMEVKGSMFEIVRDREELPEQEPKQALSPGILLRNPGKKPNEDITVDNALITVDDLNVRV